MAFNTVLAVANRNNASGQSPAVPVPAGLTGWTIRVDLATPNTFNDPAGEHLTLAMQYSYDGGTTWHDIAGGTIDGSANGIWGKGSANPYTLGSIDPDFTYPTHARGSYSQIGHYSFGLSIETV